MTSDTYYYPRNIFLICEICILGELIVRLPQEASHVLVEGRPFRLTIEYSLEKPQGGLHFVVPKDPTGIEVR